MRVIITYDTTLLLKHHIHAIFYRVFDKIFSLDSIPDRCPEAPESQFVKYLVRQLLIGDYRVLFRVVDDTVRVLDFKGGRQNKPE